MDSGETITDSFGSNVSTIVLLSIAMLIGCYLAGSIPLAFPLSEDRLHLVSVLGAGLLIGTALAVIIPEGVNALYLDSHAHSEAHSHRNHENGHHEHHSLENVEIASEIATQRRLSGVHAIPSSIVSASEKVELHDHGADSGIEVHSLIGLMLVLGFVFMMLVDQLSSGSGHTHSATSDAQPSFNITATLGLVVHAAADGVALGAAAKSSHKEVEMIVFVAIMLHKAPAAFGLVTFLLSEGLDRVRIRRHLLFFAAAAPITALLTFFGLSQQNKESLSSSHTTGSAMLFSAGTFLYVSTVHVLPEIARSRPTPCISGSIEVGKSNSSAGIGHFNKKELLVIVIGALMPMLLSMGHHH